MTKSISESNTNLNSQTSLQTISQTIDKLRAFSEMDVREDWRCFLGDISVAEVFASDFSNWETRELNEKGHIAWEKGKKVLWLAQKLTVPQDLQGYPVAGLCLRLALVWWADSAQIYINGSKEGEGDLFDFSQRVLLTESVNPGEEFTVALRLVSPGHDNGALVSSKCVYETVGNQENKVNNIYPGFVASELAIVQRYYQAFAPDELDVIADLVKEVTERINRRVAENTEEEKEEEFNKLLTNLQNNLQSVLESLRGRTSPPSTFRKISNTQSKTQNLKSVLESLGGRESTPPTFRKIKVVGHAHLDMAWLWPVSDTWEAAKNTFASVLKLQEDFPELIFCHSTPALYAWVEENCPDLFAQIKKAVKNNLWEIVGAFWVEPELNIISGESIVRQLLYGQRYVKEKFGQFSTVAWLPDSFGFCWTLPQFMVSAGVEYFVTQKLIWNDTTDFPHGTFWWRSPDGSEIFSLMSAPIGEGIDPVKMVEHAIAWEKQTGLKNYLWLPGVGDHGGGPTRDMLEIARRWQDSNVCPEFEFTTVEKYLEEIKEEGKRRLREGEEGEEGERGKKIVTNSQPLIQNPKSPIQNWNDELYLEFHRGCYTTHGDQKLYNRRGENLLYEAELFASLASIICGIDYPKAEIEAAWKKLLFNQFHDILPGSSIVEVYQDAEPEWQEMQNTATEILDQSLQNLVNSINLPKSPKPDSLPVVVFNSLNWQRSEVVSVSLPGEANNQQWQVYDSSGNQIASQIDADSNLLFLANDIPGIGYNLFWLTTQKTSSQNQSETIALQFDNQINNQKTSSQNQSETIALQFNNQINNQKTSSQNQSETIALQFILDNEFLRVVVDEETGDLNSVFDKSNNREILSANGNQLQAFKDEGQYWDAWNIDPNYAEHILPPLKLKSIEWLERGLLQQRLRVVRQLGESEFIQDYILQVNSPVLKIHTKVNWLERHILVKAAFPLNLEADFATYEIPCGAIQRTTKPQTAAEKAKWEVPALRWADLTEEKDNSGYYGVSLLNDCKYGYDAQPNQLRLSLLRSPEWPNPEADKGNHEFSYGLYPHTGTWEKAQTVKHGYEFNQPLKVVLGQNKSPNQTFAQTQILKDKASFIDISGQNSNQNLILMAFKQAEDNPQQWILRCYESNGDKAELQLTSDIGLNVKESVDLLENPASNPENSSESTFTIKPWKITSFTVNSEQ
ncbi:MAG: alpha-mannosidase [Cyanobacteria bacterium J06643_5]